ncbi:hypothetical protein [Bacteriophage sp.]|nr:hypothetical protein [Bacteriophage sp.]
MLVGIHQQSSSPTAIYFRLALITRGQASRRGTRARPYVFSGAVWQPCRDRTPAVGVIRQRALLWSQL